MDTKKAVRPENPSCSAVVCAFNEEEHLASVLEALLASRKIDEIIVVDDGSTDGTAAVAASYGLKHKVRPVFIAPNKGKGNAMAEGAALACGDILLFVDADLVNWSEKFADRVLDPVIVGEVDMAIGNPVVEGDPWDRADPLRLQHWIAGERALWREDLLPILDAMRRSRFGVETLINMRYKTRHWRVRLVRLEGLIHPIKFEKELLAKAWLEYAKAAAQILRTLALHPLLAFMTIMPDFLDLRDAALALKKAISVRRAS